MNVMMNNKMSFFYVGLVLLTLMASVQAQESRFRFLATGDLPYAKTQDVAYRHLLRQSEKEDFAFLMHVGDFKAQGVACSDEEFLKIRDLFRAYPKPVVYTPGDNEWTDCHGVNADPIERLKKIRSMFYNDPATLRLKKLNVKQQSGDPKFSKYEENYRFTKAGVSFIVVHVVGSNNNHRTDDPPSMAEFKERNAANLAFLKESFAEAIANDAPGVAVIIHANPDFETGSKEGFKDFLASMRGFLSDYQRPVVCIHGDTHYYRVDKPLKDSKGKLFTHFTRLEVFGSPNVAGVVVSVDTKDPQVFSFRPYYANKE